MDQEIRPSWAFNFDRINVDASDSVARLGPGDSREEADATRTPVTAIFVKAMFPAIDRLKWSPEPRLFIAGGSTNPKRSKSAARSPSGR